ncbi:MAG: alpha-amylase family glycosyl hydrolase [Erysipelotrichaceae bacterium]
MRDTVIYQVFTRNHKGGTLLDVANDLPRIKALGADVVYLMPIHPVGEKARKGGVGSPYAIRDYYAIDTALGTMADFEQLISQAHTLGLKVMMDIVINHSAPDHPFTLTHPEYYFKNAEGNFANQVGDWSDIIDFDYQNQALRDEMITMLSYWADKGVDGYRCDVASFLPLDFWKEAKATINGKHPGFIWLAESIHRDFVKYRRDQNTIALSDSELYQVFDICYDYDINHAYVDVFKADENLLAFTKELQLQETIYPVNYNKLRFLENHDQPRIHALTKCNNNKTLQWLAYAYLTKGTTFLYAGQEVWATHTPSLFDADEISFTPKVYDLEPKLQLLKQLKCDIAGLGACEYQIAQDCMWIQVSYRHKTVWYDGIFNVLLQNGVAPTTMPDGEYINLWDQSNVVVQDGTIALSQNPIIIKKVH